MHQLGSQTRTQTQTFVVRTASIPVLPSASTVQVLTTEAPISRVISPRRPDVRTVEAPTTRRSAAPAQVVRRRSGTPQGVRLATTSFVPVVKAISPSPVTSGSVSSRVTLCSTQPVTSPKMPWATLQPSPRTASPVRPMKTWESCSTGVTVPRSSSFEEKDAPLRYPEAHAATEPPSARSSSPCQHQPSVARTSVAQQKQQQLPQPSQQQQQLQPQQQPQPRKPSPQQQRNQVQRQSSTSSRCGTGTSAAAVQVSHGPARGNARALVPPLSRYLSPRGHVRSTPRGSHCDHLTADSKNVPHWK